MTSKKEDPAPTFVLPAFEVRWDISGYDKYASGNRWYDSIYNAWASNMRLAESVLLHLKRLGVYNCEGVATKLAYDLHHTDWKRTYRRHFKQVYKPNKYKVKRDYVSYPKYIFVIELNTVTAVTAIKTNKDLWRVIDKYTGRHVSLVVWNPLYNIQFYRQQKTIGRFRYYLPVRLCAGISRLDKSTQMAFSTVMASEYASRFESQEKRAQSNKEIVEMNWP